MTERPPEWSDEEFAVLLTSSELTAEELSHALHGKRSPGAIDVVRQGVKLYYEGKETQGILSKRMSDFLARRPQFTQWVGEQLTKLT